MSEKSVEIRAIEAEIAELRQKLSDASARLFAAKMAVSPIQIGELVEATGNKEGIYKVASVSPDYGWVKGFKQRKDGSFGTFSFHLYGDWKKVSTRS